MATRPTPAAMDEELQSNMRSRLMPGNTPPPGAVPQEGADPEAGAERADTGDAEGSADASDPNEAAEQGGPRQATPEEQKMFDTMGRQALELMTSDTGARTLYRLAKDIGPEKALAQIISKTFDGVEQAAAGAGVQLPEAIKPAVAQPVVAAMCTLLAKGGLVPDAGQSARAVMQLLAQPEPADQPGEI